MAFEYKAPAGFRIKSFAVGPLQCNCSLLWDEISKDALLIDPGDEAKRIQKEITTLGLNVKYILHTHAHFDHVGASTEMHASTKAPLLLHPGDEFLWDNLPMQGQLFGAHLSSLERWNQDLEDGMQLMVGKIPLNILWTPGHTPGSCCFSIDEILFSGDTLFQGSIGRTDLWGGDHRQIEKSIRDRLYKLDGDTQVICGHGPNTKIGLEKKMNAFVRA